MNCVKVRTQVQDDESRNTLLHLEWSFTSFHHSASFLQRMNDISQEERQSRCACTHYCVNECLFFRVTI